MKNKTLGILIGICIIGLAVTTVVYFVQAARANEAFDGELDVNRLERLVADGGSFTVYFYGAACPDCVRSEPDLRAALVELRASGVWSAETRIYKCEREANATVRSLFGIEQTPTLVVFENGRELRRLEGAADSVAAYRDFLAGEDE